MANFPPPFPPKPSLYDEVDWGSLPSVTDYQQAYNAWKLPYDTLNPDDYPEDEDEPKGIPDESWKDPLEALVGHIHYWLRCHHDDVPLPDPDAQTRLVVTANAMLPTSTGWPYDQFFLMFPKRNPIKAAAVKRINGILLSSCVKPQLMAELANRGVPVTLPKTVPQLKKILIEDELRHLNVPEPEEKVQDMFPRSKLEKWNLGLQTSYLIPFSTTKLYSPFELYTIAIFLSPYNPTYWIARAYLFYQQGYYDLALGDAYRALYLVEVIVDVVKRSKRPGLYTHIWDAIENHIIIAGRSNAAIKALMTRDQGVPYFTTAVRKVCHHLIAVSLYAVGAVEDAIHLDLHLLYRQRQAEFERVLFRNRHKRGEDLLPPTRAARVSRHENEWFEERMGSIYNTEYPQARSPAIDRTDVNFTQRLTEEFVRGWDGDLAPPLLTVEPDSINEGLRVVANVKIPKGEILYVDEPSVRGHLRDIAPDGWVERRTQLDTNVTPHRGTNRYTRKDPYHYCDNCKRIMTVREVNEARVHFWKAWRTDQANNNDLAVKALTDECACLFADPLVVFCTGGTGRVRAPLAARASATPSSGDGDGDGDGSGNGNGNGGGGGDGDGDGDGDGGGGGDGGGDDGDGLLVAQGTSSCRAGPVDEEMIEAESGTCYARAARQPTTRGRGGRGGRGTKAAAGGNKAAAGPTTRATRAAAAKTGAAKTGAATGGTTKATAGKKRRVGGDESTAAAKRQKKQGTTAKVGAPGPEPKLSCLEIARAKYHHRACGRNWGWLHKAMGKYRVRLGSETEYMFACRHGTMLSLLLREVFDMTLTKRGAAVNRGGDPHILPFEIDAMLPLDGGSTANGQRFPFGWTANIVTPFDILESLGVNIFKELDFDTWVIQTCLRKLLINAVPWTERVIDGADPMGRRDLYIHTGFAMFNHGCGTSQNAKWCFDMVPDNYITPATRASHQPHNRVIVVATKDINKGEEIRLNYVAETVSNVVLAGETAEIANEQAMKLFGKPCNCQYCESLPGLIAGTGGGGGNGGNGGDGGDGGDGDDGGNGDGDNGDD